MSLEVITVIFLPVLDALVSLNELVTVTGSRLVPESWAMTCLNNNTATRINDIFFKGVGLGGQNYEQYVFKFGIQDS